MKRYEGTYASFDESVWCNSLWHLQEHIENASGYEGNPNNDFKLYETAWIYEYNLIGRCIANYYFSMRDKEWHRGEFEITNYQSWSKAKSPFKQIAQWLLDILGFKKEQDTKIEKFVQKKEIEKLYGNRK